MKIGQIKSQLKNANQDINVYFDFCRCVPTFVRSWRGIYAEPALGWEAERYGGDTVNKTVAQVLEELEKATDGRKYTGWKGGGFSYNDNDILHVDNAGECTNTEIVFIEINEFYVILHTKLDN